jgi:hypothetical protein
MEDLSVIKNTPASEARLSNIVSPKKSLLSWLGSLGKVVNQIILKSILTRSFIR